MPVLILVPRMDKMVFVFFIYLSSKCVISVISTNNLILFSNNSQTCHSLRFFAMEHGKKMMYTYSLLDVLALKITTEKQPLLCLWFVCFFKVRKMNQY